MMALANMTKTVTADRFNGVLTAIELTNEVRPIAANLRSKR